MESKPKSFITFLLILLLGGVLAISYFAVTQRQEVRQKAATPTGPASLILSPSADEFSVGKAESIKITANAADIPIDGYQVIAKIEGILPPDLTFVPVENTDIQVVKSEITDIDTTTKQFSFAVVTKDPQKPIVQNGLLPLGEFRFTPSTAGTFSVTFDRELTKVTRNNSPGEDILSFPTDTTYTIVQPSITPTPTDPIGSCRNSGGEWKQFTNSCADNCYSSNPPQPIACAQVLTMSCDCGTNACWNGTKCTANQPPPPTPTSTPVNDCVGKQDGATCALGMVCPVCPPESTTCSKRPCYQQSGVCRNQTCGPLVSPSPTPTQCQPPPPCNGKVTTSFPTNIDSRTGVSCPTYRCIPVPTSTPTPPALTARPVLCAASDISDKTLSAINPVSVAMTALKPVSRFMLAFYNLDNLYSPGNPKPIMWETGKGYTQSIVYPTADPRLGTKFTISLTDLNHPDLNAGGKVPTRIQVNGYFFDAANNLSLPDPKCVQQFSVSIPVISRPPTPTLTVGCITMPSNCGQKQPDGSIIVCSPPPGLRYCHVTPSATLTSKVNQCTNQSNGTTCTVTVCSTCVSGQPCLPQTCYGMPGTCQSGQCTTKPTPTPTPSLCYYESPICQSEPCPTPRYVCPPPRPSPTPTPSPVPVNNAPKILNRNLPEGRVGTKYSAEVIATDPDPGDNVTITASGLPNGLRLNCNPATKPKALPQSQTSCRIEGNPGKRGTFDVVIQARDSRGASTRRTFSLTILRRKAPLPALQPLFDRLPF